MATTMGILHLRPRPPSHALPPATTPSSRLILSRSSLSLRPLPGLKMQTGTARLRHVSRCATDGAFEPSPEEDPRTSRFREEMDKEYRAALRTQKAMAKELEATSFCDEGAKLDSYVTEIVSSPLILSDKARELAVMVCSKAFMAIDLSIRVAANAHLRVDASSEMSPYTVKQIIRTYVSIFLKTAEDACRRRFDRTVFISFIDALRGLAAISHILFEDTLAVVNNVEDSSSYYSPGCDVEALNHELQFSIKELLTSLTTAPERNTYELLWPALSDATLHVWDFVIRITDIRNKALAHAQARSNDKYRRNK
ncbi:hypothetical protein EJB05_10635 [Eragrostis curvula]|uniref:Uncharacterized protein n=1 Tax=Eragrostis curvula TaxID=38414 RepID=A0A5J9VP88_9POAL|nr:hypothetical protein EJB05_10635 [Eragrostis curvula]